MRGSPRNFAEIKESSNRAELQEDSWEILDYSFTNQTINAEEPDNFVAVPSSRARLHACNLDVQKLAAMLKAKTTVRISCSMLEGNVTRKKAWDGTNMMKFVGKHQER